MEEAIYSILTKALILIALCSINYHNCLDGDLVHDDIFAIRDNQDVRLDTPLINLLKNDFWGKPMADPTSHKSYRPLTVLTFRLNYAVNGINPFGYHLVNVLLHVVCVLILWIVCVRIVFVRTGPLHIDLGFLSAALFAVHPIHTEAVTGIVGRAEILACLFFLLAIILYYSCIVVKSPSSISWQIMKFVLSLFFGVSAMLCKENGVTVFGVLVLLDIFDNVYQKRTNFFTSRFLLIRLTIVTGVTIASLLFRLSLLNNQLPLFSAQDNPASFSDSFLTRVLTYNYLLYFNAKLLVAPIILCYDWQMQSIPLIESIMDTRNIGTTIFYTYFIALSLSLILSKNKNHKHVLFMSLVLIALPFLPASNLFLRVGFVVAERILYIPSIGYCTLTVYGFWLIERRLKPFIGSHQGRTGLTQIVISFLVFLFTWRTILRNPVWTTRESLFVSGVLTVPGNAKVHYNMANLLKDTGRRDEAVSYYKNTLQLCVEHASAHNNLGTLLTGSEAAYHFQQAIKHNPHHYKAYYNLGNYYWDHHNQDKAKLFLKECIRINPNFIDCLLKLSHVLSFTRSNMAEAELLLNRALQINPDDPDILNNYGVLLNSLNRNEDAIEIFTKAMAIDPNHSLALAGLGRVYRSIGNTKLAEKLFIRSLSIRRDSSVYQSLGALYYNTGRVKQSIDMFHDAVQVDPSNVEIVCNYVQVLLSSNDPAEQEFTEPLSLLNETRNTHPNEYCVFINLAKILSTRKLYGMSIIHSTRAIELASSVQESSDAYILRATAYKDSDRLSESLKDFQKAVEGIREAASLYINIGAVYHMMGEYSNAETHYKKALELEPSNSLAQTNLKKLKRINKSSKMPL